MKANALKTLALVLAGAVVASCASAQEAKLAPPSFVVIEPHATLHVSEIQDRGWARDNSILLRTYRGTWYRATLIGGCINFGTPDIGLVSEGGMIDRGSSALIEGRECHFSSLDQIQPPPPDARS